MPRWAACYSRRTSPVYPATRRVASVHPSPVAIQVPATQALPHAACPLDAGSGAVVLLHAGGGGDGRMWELAGYTAALAGTEGCWITVGMAAATVPRSLICPELSGQRIC